MTTTTRNPYKKFSVDLVKMAHRHIEFLRALHEHSITLSHPSVQCLRRYRDLWLPLVVEHSTEKLIPPADIAWLWHCHRLAPHQYSSYCQRNFGGMILEANPPFTAHFTHNDEVFCIGEDDEMVQGMVSRTRTLWNEAYPSDSFHLSESVTPDRWDGVGTDDTTDPNLYLDGFDLLSSTDRQATFLWQVSGPNFSVQSFLEEGLVNYYKFLLLKKSGAPGLIIVPTYQIDLLWHTAILSSIAGYYQDCKAIIGITLHHDDSLNDRTEGGALDTAFIATTAAWKEAYGEEYHVEGGMYRGEPPMLYYSPAFVMDSKMADMFGAKKTQADHHPFNKLIGIHGASSTNPAPNDGSDNMEVIWCWKETQLQMKTHATTEIVGDPADCWIRYETQDNETLESAFQEFGKNHTVTIGFGSLTVDFSDLKQTNVQTGFKCEVKRLVKETTVGGQTSIVSTVKNQTQTSPIEKVAVATPDIQWTDPRGLAPDGSPGFVEHAKRSTTKRENANPMKTDYIFGNEKCGIGYYHITTREAYKILNKRIAARVRQIEVDINLEMCCNCGGAPTPYVVRKEKWLRELISYQSLVKARATADRPVGDVNDRNCVSRSNGIWLFPPVLYDCAGGCGTSGWGSGGCGGGVCGGGACGGGGCGGGGCGGGGRGG